MRHSENDILFPHRSAPFVRRPSLCRNYDSPSGMQRWVPRWHLSALPEGGLTISPTQRNEQGCSLGARLPGRPTPLLRHLPPPPTHPLFVRQGQGTKCWVIHIKLSGWKRLQMLLFFVFGFVSSLCLFSQPLHLVSAGCQGAWRVRFLKSWKNVAREREVEALAPAPRELAFFIFFAFTAKSTK